MKLFQATFASLLERQRPGWSLQQPFYLDPDIFAFERAAWLARQWVVVGHASELAEPGQLIVRSLFGESIIVLRTSGGEVRAYYNVCSHRGSRLCEADGRARLIVCPYHAWSFRLTGELQTRQDVPEGVDPDQLGLRPAPVRVQDGVILCAPASGLAPDPDAALARASPALKLHGMGRARIVARKTYPTFANWKLVLENAFECYHCRPAHPEYFGANGHVSVSAMRDAARGEAWVQESEAWRRSLPAGHLGVEAAAREDPDGVRISVRRQPIGGGRLSLSQDGGPVAPVMGGFAARDGGETLIHLGALSFLSAANDYATLVQIEPTAVEHTNMTLTWLVDADATAEVDADAVSWMWDVTTRQDKRIIEANAAGVRSSAYRPGPYTALEAQTAGFISSYLRDMRRLAGPDAR